MLVAIRIGMVLVMTPVLGSTGLPARLRVLLVLAIAALLASLPGVPQAMPGTGPLSLVLAAGNEAIWGGMLAFGVLAAFSAFTIAGRLLDLQAGFGLANLIDPATRNHGPLLGVLLNLFGIAWFLAAGLDHAIVRALVSSLVTIPPGSPLGAVPLDAMLRHFALMFSLGVVLVAPVALCLLLIDIALGLATRVLPQANVFLLSASVKIPVTLAMLAAGAPQMGPAISRIFSGLFDYWHLLLAR